MIVVITTLVLYTPLAEIQNIPEVLFDRLAASTTSESQKVRLLGPDRGPLEVTDA